MYKTKYKDIKTKRLTNKRKKENIDTIKQIKKEIHRYKNEKHINNITPAFQDSTLKSSINNRYEVL